MNGLEHYKSRQHLSPSSLCVMARCPRKFFYQCGVGLTDVIESIPMVFGEALHCALPFAFTGELDKALDAFDKVWMGREGDKVRHRAKAIAIIKNFFETHSSDKSIYLPQLPPKSGVRVDDPRSAYELPFAIDVGLPIPLVGRIDCCGRHRDTGEFVGVEFKTASRTGTTYFQAFTRSPQFVAYALALETMTGEKVDTIFLEVIPTMVTNDSPFIVPISFLHHYYEPFLQWIQYTFHLMKDCEDREEWPQNFAGCNSYASFGMAGYSCPYESLCKLRDWTDGMEMYERVESKPFIIEGCEGGE